MTRRWIVTALGKDRPGIVAGVTELLYQLGCNLEDSAMTRLEGEFAIMLIFSSAAKLTNEQLSKAFDPLKRRLGLVVHLKPLTAKEAAAPRKQGPSYVITVYGADRPGIVSHVSGLLARLHANITNVHTHRSGAGRHTKGPSLYLLILEIELPARANAARLERELKRQAASLGVEVSVRQHETAVL